MSIRISANAVILKDQKILLVKFKDDKGGHYNLPGGGVEIGESVEDALKRECLEEVGSKIEIDSFLGVWEYLPHLESYKYGNRQKLGLLFLCSLLGEDNPRMPPHPDAHQVAVEWVDLEILENFGSSQYLPLYPNLGSRLIKAIREREATFFGVE